MPTTPIDLPLLSAIKWTPDRLVPAVVQDAGDGAVLMLGYMDAEALRRLPPYATALGEVVGSGPGFQINLYGLPPPSTAEVLLDLYFQPGKLPASLADMLRGYISERLLLRPKSP